MIKKRIYKYYRLRSELLQIEKSGFSRKSRMDFAGTVAAALDFRLFRQYIKKFPPGKCSRLGWML